MENFFFLKTRYKLKPHWFHIVPTMDWATIAKWCMTWLLHSNMCNSVSLCCLPPNSLQHQNSSEPQNCPWKQTHFNVQHSDVITVNDTPCIGWSSVLFAPRALCRPDVSSTNQWIHSTMSKTTPKQEKPVWAAWSGPILQRFVCPMY